MDDLKLVDFPMTQPMTKGVVSGGQERRTGQRRDPDFYCRADQDGDCYWDECPQLRDGEPEASGRHCPLDHGPYEGEDDNRCTNGERRQGC